MSAEQDRSPSMDEQRQQLIREAQANEDVAEAIAVFEAASARAPQVPPPLPDFRFTTGANS